GGSSFAIALADKLKELDYPVLITDSSRGRLRSATQKGINTHHGEILAEHARYEADLTPYTKMLVMTIDTSYNVLVTHSFAPEFGYQFTFSITPTTGSNIYNVNMLNNIRSQLLYDYKANFDEIILSTLKRL